MLQAIACPAFRFGHLTFGGHGLRWLARRENSPAPDPHSAASTRRDERHPRPMTDLTDWHPALAGGCDTVPSLTLVLLRHLDTDQAARGIVQAVEQARAAVAPAGCLSARGRDR